MTDEMPALSFDHAAWMQRAACRGNGPDTFFPSGRADAAVARLICDSCPVKAECLDYATRNGDLTGIWGGTSEKQRRLMRVAITETPQTMFGVRLITTIMEATG